MTLKDIYYPFKNVKMCFYVFSLLAVAEIEKYDL